MPVSAKKLQEGIPAANRALAAVMEEFGQQLVGEYDISEIEVPVSFDSDGRFIGFGPGGSLTIKLKLTPIEADDMLADRGDELLELGDDEDDEDLGEGKLTTADLDDDDADLDDEDADA